MFEVGLEEFSLPSVGFKGATAVLLDAGNTNKFFEAWWSRHPSVDHRGPTKGIHGARRVHKVDS